MQTLTQSENIGSDFLDQGDGISPQKLIMTSALIRAISSTCLSFRLWLSILMINMILCTLPLLETMMQTQENSKNTTTSVTY